MASVRLAARILVPNRKKRTNAPHAEQGVDDGGDAGKVDDGQVDGPREPVVWRVLTQVEGGGDADGHGRQQGHDHQPDGTHQSRQDAPRRHAVRRRRKQELPGQSRAAPYDQEAQDQEDRDDEGDGHQEEPGLHQCLVPVALLVQGGRFEHPGLSVPVTGAAPRRP